jgi:tetratricopeptide (TPR) repeat protein
VARPSRLRTFITCLLLATWCAILAGGVITWINPPWLQEVSRPGRMSEAGTHEAAGVQRLRQGDFLGAIVALEDALAIFDDPQTRVHLGIAYAQAGQLDHGLAVLRQVLDTNPDQFLRGVILFNIGELFFKIPAQRIEAVKYYQEALERGAEPDAVHHRIGQIRLLQGKPQEALAEFEKSVRAQLDPAQGYRNMLQRAMEGYSIAATDEIEAQAAAGITEQFLREHYDLKLIYAFQRVDNRELSQTYYLLGNVHAMLGDFAAARDTFSEAVRVWPGNQDAAEKKQRAEEIIKRQAAQSAPARQAEQQP